MRNCNHRRFRQQVNFLRRQFLQDDELPFAEVFSADAIKQAMTALGDGWIDRIYTPLVTLWVFLGQVLSADHSCRAAVARLIAHRISQGLLPCSAETSAYCQARKRLPETFLSNAARQVGQTLQAKVDSEWLWKGKRVYAYDGSTVTMPDTLENQEAYPQIPGQKPGLGFPIARLAALFSLSCGTVIDLGICRYAGKEQSELGLLRKLMHVFKPGDIMLGDRLMCAWTEMWMLRQRGVDSVVRFTSHRKYDFRRGLRLGKDDHLVEWPKPNRLRSLDKQARRALPRSFTMRECRVRVGRPGFRSKVLILATTLLDAQKYPKEDLAELYRQRWNAELDLRSLKITLKMDILRCKTPELVRKEIWTHILAYNLIRTIMAQAATEHDKQPRSISFKGTVQTLGAFQSLIASFDQRDAISRNAIYAQLLEAIATHRVGNRPNRFEPRKKKQPHSRHNYLTVPRHEAKLLMLKGLR